MPAITPDRLGVCSWSMQPQTPAELIDKLGQTGLNKIQLALDPIREDPATWGDVKQQLDAAGITILSGMFGTIGEDYTTPATIRETGGIVPDQHWQGNWTNIQKIANITQTFEIGVISFHAGFIPEEHSDPKFSIVVDRLKQIADLFAQINCKVILETGQENAATLLTFLDELGHPNVGVNFDPANMLLYAMGEPIPSLEALLPHVVQAHVKDARRPSQPGQWGEEVRVGTGEVDWQAFLDVLNRNNFAGNLVIEREAGDDRVGDIKAAAEHLKKLM